MVSPLRKMSAVVDEVCSLMDPEFSAELEGFCHRGGHAVRIVSECSADFHLFEQ